MDRQDRMKSATLILYRFHRKVKEIEGWSPNWGVYCLWLKERKRKNEKRRIKEELLEERRKHNDKVCRMYGIGKYANKGAPHV